MFKQKRSVRRADSTDAIATFLTRRFGVAGGLAWLGILTFGVVSEQLKTRQEVREAEQGTVEVKGAQEVTLPSGLKYTELKRGGGEAPRPGYIIAADIVAKVDERVVLNTRKAGRQLIFIFGRRQGPITKGVEEGISAMRSGGKRILVIPPDLAFGEEGATLSDGIVPPGATLVYEIELKRVSIPPS